MRSLVGPALDRLGDPAAGETDLTSKVRGLLVGAAGGARRRRGDAARGRDWYDAWEVDRDAVDPELAAAATAVVAATGDAAEYDRC